MIEPDLPELVGLRAAAHGLNLRARRAPVARLQGGHRSAQRGRGLEFEEVRAYAEGDDMRSIDWRVTARRGRPYTKVFREDRERPVWLLADLHAGLYFGSRRQLKSALLLRTAALIGWVAAGTGDRLGAIIGTGRGEPTILPPRGRQLGVLPVLQALVEQQPRRPQAIDGATGLNAGLQAALPLIRPGSLVFVLSDFAALDAASEPLLAHLSARCDARLLWLTDALESSGLPRGRFHVGLPGSRWWLDGERSRAAWLEAWNAREQHLKKLATQLALPLTRLQTADAVQESLPPLLRAPQWAP